MFHQQGRNPATTSDGSADPAAVRRRHRTPELAVDAATGLAAESARDRRSHRQQLSWYVRACQPGRCREGDVKLAPSRGQVLDHVGVTYPDLDTHVPRLRREGVKILEGVHKWAGTRAAMTESRTSMAWRSCSSNGRNRDPAHSRLVRNDAARHCTESSDSPRAYRGFELRSCFVPEQLNGCHDLRTDSVPGVSRSLHRGPRRPSLLANSGLLPLSRLRMLVDGPQGHR